MYSREIAVTNFRVGDAYAMDGDWIEALGGYRRSLERVQSAAASDPDDALARADLAENFGAVSRALDNTGQTEQGLALLRRGLALAEVEVASDRRHAELTRVLAFIHLWNAQVLSGAGNEKDALPYYRSAFTLFQQLDSVDTNDVDVRLCAAAAQLEVGRALLQQKDPEGAISAVQASLAITDPIATLPSPNQQLLYTMADLDSTMGDIFVQKAQESGIASTKRLEYWTEAMTWFQRSVSMWRRIQNPGKLGPSGFYAGHPQLLTRKLNDCAISLRKLKPSGQ